jgi:hypothetical protein
MDDIKTYKWNVSHKWMNEIIEVSGQNFSWMRKYGTYLPTCVPCEREPFDGSTCAKFQVVQKSWISLTLV